MTPAELEANAKRLVELEAKDAERRARLAQIPGVLDLLEAARLSTSRPC